jgi:hypothetical protein
MCGEKWSSWRFPIYILDGPRPRFTPQVAAGNTEHRLARTKAQPGYDQSGQELSHHAAASAPIRKGRYCIAFSRAERLLEMT